MRPLLIAALLLTACQAPPPPAPTPSAGPTPGAIRFSTAAIGPVALAGGAVVVDPGVLCPAASLRVVGAGLPPGRVAITLEPAGQAAGDPADIRPDGSFDRTLPFPGLPAGTGRLAVVVTLGDARATVPLPVCIPASPVPGLVLTGFRVVQ